MRIALSGSAIAAAGGSSCSRGPHHWGRKQRLAGFFLFLAAATLPVAPVAACCISETGAPHQQPLRRLIHEIAVLDLVCSGTYDIALAKHTCARRERLIRRVERMGWCWGSSGFDVPTMAFYWLPCRESRY